MREGGREGGGREEGREGGRKGGREGGCFLCIHTNGVSKCLKSPTFILNSYLEHSSNS